MASKEFTEASPIGKKLARARDLKLQIDSLTDELNALKAYLVDYSADKQLDSLSVGPFVASRRVRHNWSYSDSLESRIARVNEAKKREQVLGIAIDAPSEHVVLSFKARILAQANYASLQELA